MDPVVNKHFWYFVLYNIKVLISAFFVILPACYNYTKTPKNLWMSLHVPQSQALAECYNISIITKKYIFHWPVVPSELQFKRIFA